MPSNHVKGLKAHCPKCYGAPEKVEFWNCGPIIRLKCPECGFGIGEGDLEEGKNGLEELIKLWNQKGFYMVCD